MPQHAKLGNFAMLLVVSVLALIIIPWGAVIAQDRNDKDKEDKALRRATRRQLTPQQQYNMREYGMTFSQDDQSELDRVTDELLRKERDNGHWGGPYQEYMLYERVKHLSAASKEARTYQNLALGMPRKDHVDSLQRKVASDSIYSYVLPRALADTEKYMQEWTDQIDPEYRKLSDKDFDLIMTALPKKDTALAMLAVAELQQAIKSLEQRLSLLASEEGGCEAECKKPERSDPVQIAQVKDELEAQEGALEELESTIRQINAIGNIWNVIFDYRQSLIGVLARKEASQDNIGLSIRKDLLQLHDANQEVVAVVGDFLRALEKARKKEIAVIDLLPRTASMLDTLASERRRLTDWFNQEITRKNEGGYTWLARALMYENTTFVDFLVSWNAPGTLKQELLTSSAANSYQRVSRLLDIGADASQKAGAWSPLAYAMTYGAPNGSRIEELLVKAGVSVQVPWDPTASSGDEIARTENQLGRVTTFLNSVKGGSDSNKELAYTEKLLDYLKCRLDCIKRSKFARSKMASQ